MSERVREIFDVKITAMRWREEFRQQIAEVVDASDGAGRVTGPPICARSGCGNVVKRINLSGPYAKYCRDPWCRYQCGLEAGRMSYRRRRKRK